MSDLYSFQLDRQYNIREAGKRSHNLTFLKITPDDTV